MKTPDALLLTTDVLIVMDLLGVFVSGIVGGALGRRLQFDAVGFAVLGLVSALGGGLLRDLILDAGVPAAFASPWYLTAGLSGAFVAFLLHIEHAIWRHTTTVLDCIALGLWASIGTAKSVAHGLDPLPSILLGVVTAVGGGIIRDMAVGRIPVVFGGGPLYATAAAITSLLTWLVYGFSLPSWCVLVAAAFGAALAIFSQWRNWSLPSAPDLSVTMSPAQMRAFARRIRRSERRRVAIETGSIPIIDPTRDDLARDVTEHPPSNEP